MAIKTSLLANSMCPYCAKKSEALFTTVDLNRKVSSEKFTYFRCNTCNLIYLDNTPEDLSKYYQNSYYAIPSVDKLKEYAKKLEYQVDIFEQFSNGRRLLDIGSAFGTFPFVARSKGYDVSCIEMDVSCCEFMRKQLCIDAHQSELPAEKIKELDVFDVVTLWHNVEHLRDPWELLDAISVRLKDNGILVVATPNPESFSFRLLGASWPHVDAPRHLFLIPERTLTSYLRGKGMHQLYVTTNDRGGRSWNRFSWQRYLMNKSDNYLWKSIGFFLGLTMAFIMCPFELFRSRGSAYTVIYRKVVSE